MSVERALLMPLKRESPDDWGEHERVIWDAIHHYAFLISNATDNGKKTGVRLPESPQQFIYKKLVGRQVLSENANEVSVKAAIVAAIAIHRQEVGTGRNAKLSVDISMTRRIYFLLCPLNVLKPSKHSNPDLIR